MAAGDPEGLPQLETGWLPTTPVGDTYLRRFLLNWASMCSVAARLAGGYTQDLPSVVIARIIRLFPRLSIVMTEDASAI